MHWVFFFKSEEKPWVFNTTWTKKDSNAAAVAMPVAVEPAANASEKQLHENENDDDCHCPDGYVDPDLFGPGVPPEQQSWSEQPEVGP